MGYQESLMQVIPQRCFDKAVLTCAEETRRGYYNYMGAEPLSVITFNKSVAGTPATPNLLWDLGTRSFQYIPVSSH